MRFLWFFLILVIVLFSLSNSSQQTPVPTKPALTILTTPTPIAIRSIQHAVPFTSQSPYGNWDDERQQDGCEEASVLMAYLWVEEETTITKPKALKEILAIWNYQVTHWNSAHDTSAEDTAIRILNGYFNYSNYEITTIDSTEQIIRTLISGHLVLAPMNGQALNNPNFTSPGPERHFLVITGFDATTQEFITNDPGTRVGESYRYSKSLLFAAIRNYSTGYHIPISKDLNKTIIIVKKPTI